jgi:hypothetical protein
MGHRVEIQILMIKEATSYRTVPLMPRRLTLLKNSPSPDIGMGRRPTKIFLLLFL